MGVRREHFAARANSLRLSNEVAEVGRRGIVVHPDHIALCVSGEVPAVAEIESAEVVPADRNLRSASVGVEVNVAQGPSDVSSPVVVKY